MEKSNIALIGFRATGKTRLGRMLANALGWSFIDMDERLEASSGESIQDRVQTSGWASFRAAESKLLEELARGRNLVVATGGGVVLSEANRATLRRNFQVLRLKAAPQTIISRLRADPKTISQRPSLTGLPLEAEVTGLLDEREGFYESCADFTLETDVLSASELLSEVMRLPLQITSPSCPPRLR